MTSARRRRAKSARPLRRRAPHLNEVLNVTLASTRACASPWPGSLEVVDLGGPEVARVDLDVFFQSSSSSPKATSRHSRTLCDFARRDDVVVAPVLLEHHPHGLDVVAREAPVAETISRFRGRACARGRGGCRAVRVILRVTNGIPRRGDSWLKRMRTRCACVGVAVVLAELVGRRPWRRRTGCAAGTACSRPGAAPRPPNISLDDAW